MSRNLRAKILAAVKERGPSKTICPSEVLPLAERKMKARMQEVRDVAQSLIDEGLIEATAKNKLIDLKSHRGPIRLRLKKP